MKNRPTLCESSIAILKNKKNLLAFSAGVDSSALFFLLLDANIPFDVAHVNYQTRKNSDKEALYVKDLAKKYDKKAFVFTCKLEKANFEHNARTVRYEFFEEIIAQAGYENLILAHQFDDRFEWFMMQLCKGAGVSELSGFNMVENRDGYTLLRPLWRVRKKELKEYLDKHNLPYFEDESNLDKSYKRNYFRHDICTPLLEDYEKGIRKSLDFIAKDAKILQGEFLLHEKKLSVYKLQNEQMNIRLIDKAIKKLGFVMSEESRKEALKENAVISRSVAVGYNELYGFIAPYVKIVMPKEFKEACRLAKIPLHIRGYMYQEGIIPKLCYEE